jgi:hypothetical protein
MRVHQIPAGDSIVVSAMAPCTPCASPISNFELCISNFNPSNITSNSDVCHFEPNPRWVLSMLCYRESIIGLVDLIQGLALVATFINTLMRYAICQSSTLSLRYFILSYFLRESRSRHYIQDEHEQDSCARRCQRPRPGAIIFYLHSILAIDMLYATIVASLFLGKTFES